jgi:hypothetical protein
MLVGVTHLACLSVPSLVSLSSYMVSCAEGMALNNVLLSGERQYGWGEDDA